VTVTGLQELAGRTHRGLPLAGADRLLESFEQLAVDTLGAGPLEQLLRDPEITDVLVNGPGPVWVDRGQGVQRSHLSFEDDAALRRLARRLVAACGRRLDDAAPFADARLPDGTRVHAVLAPISPAGTCLSLRLPPRRTFSLDDLVAARALPPAGAELLEELVESRTAFVVTGGAGVGKTTVLSSLLSRCDPGERIVLVEDIAELRPQHPHVVRLEAQRANAEGSGAVELAELVRQALRMRPDRLVVGEARGGEVVDMLSALNTGHEGGAGTLHANRPGHVPARFEALGTAAGLSRAAVHAQLAAAVAAVVHLSRDPRGRRRVHSLAALVGDERGLVQALTAYRFRDGRVEPGPGIHAWALLREGSQ
jgi:pilus assembly protein CpaF